MVDGTTTTAATTTTTTSMLGLSANTQMTTKQSGNTMTGSLPHQPNTIFALSGSSDDALNRRRSSLDNLMDSDDSDYDHFTPWSDNATLRLPSGKTIARRTNGPHTSKNRHRVAPSSDTTSHTNTFRKVHGNCAIIANPGNLKTQLRKSRYPATPPTSDEEGDCDSTSLASRPRSSHDLVIPRVHLSAHRTTIRDSDAQMLSTLPASIHRNLLAASKKAVEGARRAEQEYRGNLDGYGNMKSKERFVNDVPGGRSHKNRFMAQ